MIWGTAEDYDLFAEHGVTIAHNPACNMRLASGMTPVNRLLERGVNVMIGTDSVALNDDDDIIQEMRLAFALHREPGVDGARLNAHQVLAMATKNAAAPMGLGGRIGMLKKGYRADAVLVDIHAMSRPYLDEKIDLIDAFMTRAKADHVDTVVINGETILQGGQFTRHDFEEISRNLEAHFTGTVTDEVRQAREFAAGLRNEMRKFFRTWPEPKGASWFLANSSK